MPLIPEPVLDDIQSRTDIAELIGRYIPLQRAGRNFKALCPFHKERTPSFHINTEKQIFHCFGCGVGGNVFSFLMQYERLTFRESVQRLATELGVSLPEAPRDTQIEPLLGVLEKACAYYERLLAHPKQGRQSREYLQQRGMTQRGRDAFRVGSAPAAWDQLIQASRKGGVSVEVLEQAGLTVRGSRGMLDRFRQRLMFPIQDVRGRVVGFGGRSMAGQEPKYLNSPETAVYHKGRQLFGLPQAKTRMLQTKSVVVVEGYFDCAILWQAGIEHVVSPLGTAFTPEQAQLLARYAERVILAFDADAAGEAASMRGIDVLLEAGLHVSVAQFPSGVDPDELVTTRGAEEVERLLAASVGIVEFLVTCAKKRHDCASPEGKARAVQSLLTTLTKVPDRVLRAEYVRMVADLLHLDEQAVSAELSRARVTAPRRPVEPMPKAQPLQGVEPLLTALIVDRPQRLDSVKNERLIEQIRDARLRRVLCAVAEVRATQTGEPEPAQIISRLEGQGMEPLVAELVELAQTVSSKEQAFRDCVDRLAADAHKRRVFSLRDRIQEAQRSGHEREVTQLLQDYQRLVKGSDEGLTEAAHEACASGKEGSGHGIREA